MINPALVNQLLMAVGHDDLFLPPYRRDAMPITITIHPVIRIANAVCPRISVLRCDVASSRIRIGKFFNIARAAADHRLDSPAAVSVHRVCN
jgi:hypothetical protein